MKGLEERRGGGDGMLRGWRVGVGGEEGVGKRVEGEEGVGGRRGDDALGEHSSTQQHPQRVGGKRNTRPILHLYY